LPGDGFASAPADETMRATRPAMDKNSTTKTLLARRKLTRTIGLLLAEQMKAHIATLAPLFRQKSVFGVHVQGGGTDQVKTADQAFKELQALYERVATAAPFLLPKELESPLMQMTSSLELTPWEYVHEAKSGGDSKGVTVTCPFKSILTYSGYAPHRLKSLLNDRNRSSGELQIFVLHYLTMHIVVAKQPGLARLLEALHFPLATGHLDLLGNLPITYIGSAISTSLPSDELVIESTEMSGTDAFEEIANIEDIKDLRDPLKERMLEIVKGA
jgi:hypothetical protein